MVMADPPPNSNGPSQATARQALYSSLAAAFRIDGVVGEGKAEAKTNRIPLRIQPPQLLHLFAIIDAGLDG